MVPEIDCTIGISIYSTKSSGCGGKIREKPEDFVVSETLSQKTLSEIEETEGYAVYKLKKQNIDTNHALDGIFRKTGHRLKALGLKDSFAITEQYVCSKNKSKSLDEFKTDRFSITKIGYVKKPLSKKDMIGNHFSIKIVGNSSSISSFTEFDKILNFYGYQRFGSKRPVTHLIGRAIVLGDYSKAIDLLLSFTSAYDSQKNSELRNSLKDKSNYPKTLKEIPKQMDLERIVIKEMIEHDDPKKALMALPLSIRRFYVQAFQSFIFNKTLCASFEGDENLFFPKEGDVCFDEKGILGKFLKGSNQFLAIPTVGHSYYKKTRFHYYISKILESEEILPRDFFLKDMQELSIEAGFRNASVRCTNFSFNDSILNFSLSRGSFATIILREVMKPQNPILAGF